MCAGILEGQKRISDPLESQLQGTETHLTWEAGTEKLGSSAKAICVVNCEPSLQCPCISYSVLICFLPSTPFGLSKMGSPTPWSPKPGL